MNPLRFHLFKTESFKVSIFEIFVFLYIYAFVFLYVYISTHLYLQIYRNSFSIQQRKKHQNVAGQGEKYYICRYEERIRKMADGYSQVYHNSSNIDINIRRCRTEMDNLSWWDISRGLYIGVGIVSCQGQKGRRMIWEH